MNNTCQNCTHWIPKKEKQDIPDGTGECHRFPPSVVFDPEDFLFLTWWPTTSQTDSCGEWRNVQMSGGGARPESKGEI